MTAPMGKPTPLEQAAQAARHRQAWWLEEAPIRKALARAMQDQAHRNMRRVLNRLGVPETVAIDRHGEEAHAYVGSFKFWAEPGTPVCVYRDCRYCGRLLPGCDPLAVIDGDEDPVEVLADALLALADAGDVTEAHNVCPTE